jgi:hypothetical protein
MCHGHYVAEYNMITIKQTSVKRGVIPKAPDWCLDSHHRKGFVIRVDNGWIPSEVDDKVDNQHQHRTLNSIVLTTDTSSPWYDIKRTAGSPRPLIAQWEMELSTVVAKRLGIPHTELVIEHPKIVNWMLMELLGVFLRNRYFKKLVMMKSLLKEPMIVMNFFPNPGNDIYDLY